MVGKKEDIAGALLTVSLSASILFYCVMAFMGTSYAGAESSSSYIYSILAFDLIIGFYYIKLNLFNHPSSREVLFLCLLFIILIDYYLISGSHRDLLIKIFLCYSLPSALCGLTMNKANLIDNLCKWSTPVMLVITAYGVISLTNISNFLLNDMSIGGGAGSQALSYSVAFAFSINWCNILFGEEQPQRFEFTKSKLYRYFSILLIFAQLITILISGGRGGFVLFLASFLVLLWLKIRNNATTFSKVITLFVVLLLSGLVVVQFLPQSVQDMIFTGSERTFSYLTSSGIDMTQTSNRDDVYTQAVALFKESPIIGYGFFYYVDVYKIGYPHNLFLEWLLQGGVVFCGICSVILLRFLLKIKRMILAGHNKIILAYLLYPLVQLMFTGSYVGTGFLWFGLAYVYVYDYRQINYSI